MNGGYQWLGGGKTESFSIEFCTARWKSSGDLWHNNWAIPNPTEQFSKNWLYSKSYFIVCFNKIFL